jgi:hypothetical protein
MAPGGKSAMSDNNSGPGPDFSLEPSLDPQLWVVRHRATGIVFRFLLLSDDDKLDQNLTFAFERGPASDVDPATLLQSAFEAARRYKAAVRTPLRADIRLTGLEPTIFGTLAPIEGSDAAALSGSVAWTVPPQVRIGSRFTLDAAGRIDVVPDPPDHAGKAQRELYDEVRVKARELSSVGDNQLGDLAGPANRFLEALPERIEDASLVRLWSRGNTLRLRLAAHDAAAASTEPTEPGRLTELAASVLRDVVETFNAFINGDATGRELDQRRLGPQDHDDALTAVEAAAPLVEAVAGSGIATPAAEEALTEQLAAARAASSSDVDGGRAPAAARNTLGNFFSKLAHHAYVLIRGEGWFAWDKVRGFVYISGVTAAYTNREEVIKFVVDNAGQMKVLLEQVFHNPALLQIIDAIVEAGKYMG